MRNAVMGLSIMKLLTALLFLVPPPLTSAATYPITGVHTDGLQIRHEIRDLHYNYPNQWNMYILALRAFQAENQAAKLSYYQIEGIHGVPNVVWDHAQHTSTGTGYCEHDSNEFPVWHRPYVALFEQRLHHHATIIARQFPPGAERASMEGAARLLRAPYYDWAINPGPGQPVWPVVLSEPTIKIHTPTGPQTVQNPLFSYSYHPLKTEWYASPWSSWGATLRWPTSTAPNAQSQNHLVEATMKQQRPGTEYTLFQFFTNCKSWLEISNDLVKNSHPGCSTSLEQIHNNQHNFIGGTVAHQQGHMTVIPYSAHDPAFMLHHIQVDRLLAMWQAVYPDHWVPKQAQSDNTFDVSAGEVLGSKTPLKPFHNDTKGGYWTADRARHTQTFGHVYPEYQNGGDNPKTMRSRIKKLYGPGSTKQATTKPHPKIRKRSLAHPLWYETNEEAMPAIMAREAEIEASAAAAADLDALVSRNTILTPLLASNGSSYQYIANIQTTRYGLGGSYNIYLFLSDPSDPNPETWAYDPNVVGAYGVWSQAGKQALNITSSSSIPLTLALTDRVQSGVLAALGELLVVPFLIAHLEWKIVGPDGDVLDPTDVPGFKLSVVSSTLQPASTDDEFPIWSDFVELPEITKGKAGGSTGGMLGGLLGGGGGLDSII